MMEVALITDTHFNGQNHLSVTEAFIQGFNHAAETRTKTLLHLGDWFTHRTGQNLPTLIAVLNVLNIAQKMGISIITIPGNHDKTDLESEESYIEIYKDHPALRVISAGEKVPLNASIDLFFLPYFPESGTYADRLVDLSKLTAKNKTNILLTHIALDGASNNDGTKVQNNLSQAQFKKFDWVLSGHYHNRNAPWGRAQYIGSPRASNYGEDNKKGYTLLRKDGTPKFIQGSFQEFHQVFFNLQNIDTDEFAVEYEKAITLATAGHRVRAVVSGTKDMLEATPKTFFTDCGMEYLSRDISILKTIENIEQDTSSISVEQLGKLFIQYCILNNIKGDLFKMGQEFMKTIKK